ncbi:BolA family transcriptional regulator [Methylomonas paludis]|uniref:BolA family transcriptional regulator n=1 Tax=Methylomonas paludis TaxID=1173101 RepID=A0A975RAR9_9GAMM|nr:BolA family protein [Methylomonas paludis]QWF71584.1 BolA family transcriptional regulator [Methylomonas paludis]
MTSEVIKVKLKEAFNPDIIEIIDQSASHAGHSGNRKGGGHFYVTIVAESFEGLSLVKRHQLIYQVLNELMKEEIHALSINALTPSENSTGN